MERTPVARHGGATGFNPPPGVTIHQIPAEKNIGTMMLAGELDAALYYLTDPHLVHRSAIDLHAHPGIKTLFPDPAAEAFATIARPDSSRSTTAMVRRDVFEKDPWVVLNLIKAFNKANAIANERRVEQVADHLAAGLLSGDAKTPGDPSRGQGQPQGDRDHRAIFTGAGADPAAYRDRRALRSKRAGDVTARR